jgi:hypothetical protein
MPPKRRRSSADESIPLPVSKRTRTKCPPDHLSDLSDELLLRILHLLPIQTLLQCQRLSRRFYALAGDSQIWKNLYYVRFVLPRALRIPGIKAAHPDDVLNFSSKRSKWLDENSLVNRADGKKTNWKRQYKLRHNWSIGACETQEIHLADRPSVPSTLVKLAEGVVVTADKEEGLRAWDLKGKALVAECQLEKGLVPTCLAVDEQQSETSGLGIAVGFAGGGWGIWRLHVGQRTFAQAYRHPESSNGTLGAIAYANPYILTITDSQLLSLYTLGREVPIRDADEISPSVENVEEIPSRTESPSSNSPQPRLLASLKSHTSWPPLSLAIRTTSRSLIASIAYSLPTYLSGYTVGLQELHLSLTTGLVTFSRIASALPQGFSSLSSTLPSSPSPSPSPGSQSPTPWHSGSSTTPPTSLSYSHPYILATHPDNTLTLYLCTSDPTTLSISPGTKLWGHTSSVSAAEITPRGKAVSVSTRGNELRVWELEGGFPGSSTSNARKRISTAARPRLTDRSVMIRAETKDESHAEMPTDDPRGQGMGTEMEARKQWVGFDDEVVIVLKESGSGGQALMVYDFT